MTEITLAYELAKQIQEITQKTIPTVEATVLKCTGHTIWLEESPSATADAFYGGVMVVDSGDAVGLRSSIVESAGNQIILASAFHGTRKPVAGDTVTLKAGPLADAKVFLFEPDSVKTQNDLQTGYFVTVNVYSKRSSFARMNNKQRKGWLGFDKFYMFEVVAEAINYTTEGSVSALRDKLWGLKTLSEMLDVMIIDFRLDEQNGISGDGDIETTYNMIQRTGSDTLRHAAISEFAVRQR